jgi:hypothetical protein
MRDSDREAVLKLVQRVREGIEPHRHVPSANGDTWARHTFRIPERDFWALCRLYPALVSLDPEEKQRAWDAFELSPFSEAYRIGRLHRGVIKNGLIVETS